MDRQRNWIKVMIIKKADKKKSNYRCVYYLPNNSQFYNVFFSVPLPKDGDLEKKIMKYRDFVLYPLAKGRNTNIFQWYTEETLRKHSIPSKKNYLK